MKHSGDFLDFFLNLSIKICTVLQGIIIKSKSKINRQKLQIFLEKKRLMIYD